MRYGLIGEKLGHSHSKYIHERMVGDSYDLIPLNEGEFDMFMERKEFDGINVTIPYKEKVIPYLDNIHSLAKQIGAVNTIVNRNSIKAEHKKSLILGTGGTAKTALAVLKELGANEIYTVSRSPVGENQISYEECYDKHSDAELIVNTTPVGMYPHSEASPLDLSAFTQCNAVIDVIFNPINTMLTKQAKSLGILAVTGLPMLVAQAKQSEEYFRNIKLDEGIIDRITQELLERI